MAYGVLMDFATSSNEAYDRVLEAMGLTDGRPPEHALFHMAGEIDGGFRVVDIWDSVDEFQKFAQEQIGPLTQAEGLPEPDVSIWEIHNTLEREGERAVARSARASDLSQRRRRGPASDVNCALASAKRGRTVVLAQPGSQRRRTGPISPLRRQPMARRLAFRRLVEDCSELRERCWG